SQTRYIPSRPPKLNCNTTTLPMSIVSQKLAHCRQRGFHPNPGPISSTPLEYLCAVRLRSRGTPPARFLLQSLPAPAPRKGTVGPAFRVLLPKPCVLLFLFAGRSSAQRPDSPSWRMPATARSRPPPAAGRRAATYTRKAL